MCKLRDGRWLTMTMRRGKNERRNKKPEMEMKTEMRMEMKMEMGGVRSGEGKWETASYKKAGRRIEREDRQI